MPAQGLRLRHSARVFLFDEAGDVLLIRFVAELEGKPFVFWVTPGGEVEPGEDDRAAAARELFEELGLRVPLAGPVHEESGGEYMHLGERVRNFDVFFAAVCARTAPQLAGVTSDEIRLMQEMRWWSAEELAATGERVYPQAIGRVLPQARAAALPAKAESGQPAL